MPVGVALGVTELHKVTGSLSRGPLLVLLFKDTA